MRKLVLYIACSLDGFIAGPEGEIDWLFKDQDYGIAHFLNTVDTTFIGRKTYDLMVQLGHNDGYRGKINYIFTMQPEKYRSARKLFFTSQSPVEIWNSIKNLNGKNAWLVGGGEIIKPLVEANLIDEYRIFMHPVILGAGLPLFNKIAGRVNLETVSVNHFDSGLVELFLKSK